MPTATVTSKGQVTLPKKVRDVLGVKTGDRIEFILDGEGRVRLQGGTRDVRELRGILHRTGRRPVSLEAMRQAVQAGVARAARRR